MPNPHSEIEMAPSDTSETTPTRNPVRDRAQAPAAQATADRPNPPAPVPGAPDVGREGDNATVGLARIAWLITVLACVITIAILVVEGYYGYALVTLAVAVSAGINLT